MNIRHLLLITATSLVSQHAAAQSPIYKCQVKGKTIYSESPCTIGSKQTEMEIDNSRMGNVTYDRETIEAARSRIRQGMNKHAVGASMGSSEPVRDNTQVCAAVKRDIKSLDAQARQPNSGYTQDWIKKRKVEVQRKAIEWKC